MAQYGRGSIRQFFKGDPSLKAVWTFDNANPFDESGRGNHGTAVNSPAKAGGVVVPGTSYKLNAASVQYIDVPYGSGSLNIVGSITILTWIIILGAPNGAVGTIVGRNAGGYYLGIYPAYTLTWGKNATDELVSGALKTGRPYFVAVTHNGSTTRSRIFINGLRAAVANKSNFNSLTDGVRLGNALNGTAAYNGLIDETAIFNRDMSAVEIKRYFQWAGAKRASMAAVAAYMSSVPGGIAGAKYTQLERSMRGVERGFCGGGI